MTSRSSARIASITGSALRTALSAWSARSAWAALPSTVTVAHSTPTWATSAAWLNGSGISAASVRGPRARQAAAPLPVHSSSITVSMQIVAAQLDVAQRAQRAEHRDDAGLHVGGAAPVHAPVLDLGAPRVVGPVVLDATGTTSMWPLKVSERPPPVPRRIAVTFGRPA